MSRPAVSSKSQSLTLKNFYSTLPKEYKKESITYSNYDQMRINIPFRMLIVGSSGSGKTNVTLNLISLMNCFTRIYLYAKNIDEPLYKLLIDSMMKVSKKLKRNVLTVSTDISDMPDIDEVDTQENNLFIFDDLVSESVNKQKPISDLFIRGRKSNCSAIYISQSYFDVPKLIRKNCDYIIIKKINTKRDLTSIIKEYNLSDTTSDKLMEIYKGIIKKDFTNFLLIDLNTNQSEYKFRENFSPIAIV